MKKTLFAVGGFAADIYALPILIAPPAPPYAEVQKLVGDAQFQGECRRDLAGSVFSV